MLQLCPNGSRPADQVPATPPRLAEAIVAAALPDAHIHIRDDDGRESLDPAHVAAALAAIRAAAPGVTVGVSTAAWIEPDPHRRAALVRSWRVLPDHASVNWHEEGAELVAEALLERGVGIEAGLFSGTDAAERFLAWPHADRVLRVLAEVTDADPGSAEALLAALRDQPRPVLLHGEEEGAWPILRMAARLGLPTRIGLEDTLHLPDGTPAQDNTVLAGAARAILSRTPR